MNCIGTDIIEVARIQKAINNRGERFLNRIYTQAELTICKNRPWRLAARFAGKEAVMKALGTGVRGISWKEIEILAESSGKPLVHLHGKAKKRADFLGLKSIAISLSDSKEYAIAFAVGEDR
jgi:holo-[acyl-carrier protein] synthase